MFVSHMSKSMFFVKECHSFRSTSDSGEPAGIEGEAMSKS